MEKKGGQRNPKGKRKKRRRARCGTHRTGLNLAVLRRRGGLGGGDRRAMLGAKEDLAVNMIVPQRGQVFPLSALS